MKEPYRPEFVEVDIPVRTAIDGTCAWCGAVIHYFSDEGSVRCPQCGAQSAKALAPKRRERRRKQVTAPVGRIARHDEPIVPRHAAKAPRVEPVREVGPDRYGINDLGPAAVPFVGLAIGACCAPFCIPVAHYAGTTTAVAILMSVASCCAVALTLRKR